MKKKLILALALLALLCFALFGQTFGQTRTVGVTPDDAFIYSIGAFWSSNNAGAAAPEDLVNMNSTFYNMTISTISGANITTLDTWKVSNGSASTAVVLQNVDSGDSYLMKGLINIVGVNLNPGEMLYPSGDDPRKINETVSVDFGSTKRDASAVVFDHPTLDSNNLTAYEKEAYYFDRATGVLVARSDFVYAASENFSIVMVLVGTNLWAITKSPSVSSSSSPTPIASKPASDTIFGLSPPVVIAIVVAAVASIVIVAVSAVLLRERGRSRRKHRR